jgi:2-hydroxy-6-oxonona-2,4-dienedioate hydrolase
MLNFRRYGIGEPLVLVHGFVGGSGYWTELMNSFGRWRDVVAVDLPGFAGSMNGPVQTSISGFGAAVFELLDSLAIDNFSLVGHSMGGMIAQEMALSRPEAIERLILYGTTSTGDLPGRFETWDETVIRFDGQGVSASIDRIASSWFLSEDADPAYPMCRSGCEGATLEACIAGLGAIRAWSTKDRIGQLTMPVLVVVGEHDRSTPPKESIDLWQALPEARLCILPGCAHAAHLEKPRLFDTVLADFLSEAR